MEWKLVTEWEVENNKEYPHWAYVWTYDGYGECWESNKWHDVKPMYDRLRAKTKEDRKYNPAWDVNYEPMVLLPTDKHPKWGDGKLLKYNEAKNIGGLV